MDAPLLVSTSDGNRTSVGVMDVDGLGFEEVLVEYAAPVLVSWAPDYQRFAMVREVRYGLSLGLTIWSIGIDGSDRRMVLESEWGIPDRISWSPDGRTILFGACQIFAAPPRCGIFTVPQRGGEVDTLVISTQRPVHPQWSPDGKTIAFRRQFSPDPSLVMFVSDTGGEPRAVQSPRYISDLAW